MRMLVSLLAAVAFALPLTALSQPANPGTTVRAWGRNDEGQCIVPASLTNAVAIAAGSVHNLAVRADGTVAVWGTDMNPAGHPNGNRNIPPGLNSVIAVAAGDTHSLALRANGTVVAWGGNDYGQTNVPPGLSNVVAVAASLRTSLALRAGGTVAAWGFDAGGQNDMPADLTNAVAVASADVFSMALRAGGTVVAWGAAGMDPSYTTPPADLSNAIAVAAGPYHTLALRADGTAVQWPPFDYPEWSVPPGLSNVVAITAGFHFNLALRADGTVVGWGNGTFGGPHVPEDLGAAVAVSAGKRHSLGLIGPQAPAFLASPPSQTVRAGATVHLIGRAVGAPPLRYQWLLGTNAIPGATNAVLTLANLQTWQSGAYTVVVTNSADSATSEPAQLTVVTALDAYLVPAISLVGDLGATYRLEYINGFGPGYAWSSLATVTITNQPQFHCDISAIGEPKRFYRLVQLP
jgi:hypothetical protein